jgi:uncharacterized membrane protein
MRRDILAYLAALAAFVAMDMVWLGATTRLLYQPVLGDILAADVDLAPAIVFYLMFPAGLVIFAVRPALASGRLATALTYGALFGFFSYATYDLTNQATLREWALQLTLADIAWGSLLSASASAAGYGIARRFGG